MLRRTHLIPVESIDMLRERGLKRFTDVYTQDGERLGSTLRFIHRPPIEEENPELKLYRTYLVVQSIPLGGPVYVPTVFIENYDPAANRVTLAVDMATLQNETWDREPDFAAHGDAINEDFTA
jgi:hypothetical protein